MADPQLSSPAQLSSPGQPGVPAPQRLLDRYGRLLGWALFPTLALLVVFDLRLGIHGKPEVVSAQLVGFTALALASAPFWWARRHDLTRTGRLLLALATALFGYALASSLVTHLPHLQKVTVARHYLVVPVLTAIVTAASAWGLALATPAAQRRRWLWWGSATILVLSLLGWPRAAHAQGSVRLATGSLGGAATFHVVLLLCAAIFAGAALDGYRRRTSWAAAALSVVALLCTGSRAGLLCLLFAAGLLVLRAVTQGRGRLAWLVLGAGAALFAGLLALVPALRRMLSFSDDLRQTNIESALGVLGIGWRNVVFGAGSGRVWPWYAFETGRLKILWRGEVITEFGRMQTNPHSTYLGVGVELGLVGLALLLGLFAVVVAHLARQWQGTPDTQRPKDRVGSPSDAAERPAPPSGDFLVSVALVATLLASFFDYYLLKNFGVSWWWWLVLASYLGLSRSGRGRPAAPAAARSAAPAPRAPEPDAH